MNKVDRVIWRINGLLIMGVGAVVGVLALYGVYSIFKEKTRNHYRTEIVNVNEQTKKEERLNLGAFTYVQGKSYFMSPLNSSQTYDFDYSSKTASAIRNYLFYNTQDGASSWLLDNHNSLIIDSYILAEEFDADKADEYRRDIRSAAGFIFVLAKADTNNDKILNEDDNKSIVFTSFDGKGMKIILDGASRVLGIRQHSSESVIIFYILKDKNKVVEFNYKIGNVIRNAEIDLVIKK